MMLEQVQTSCSKAKQNRSSEMVLRDLGDEGNITCRSINYYLGVIKVVIIGPGEVREREREKGKAARTLVV